jgi:hypothetical protein
MDCVYASVPQSTQITTAPPLPLRLSQRIDRLQLPGPHRLHGSG